MFKKQFELSYFIAILILVFLFYILLSNNVLKILGYYFNDVQIITFFGADDKKQKALYWAPKNNKNSSAPLLVALHTWNGNYLQDYSKSYLHICKKIGWSFLHPDFRGANNNPDAAGSELAMKDVLLAIKKANKISAINNRRIYLIGYSGGGHMALLLFAKYPEQFSAISVWSPITDLVDWYDQTKSVNLSNYTDQIEEICGGDPTINNNAYINCKSRSPLTFLSENNLLPIAIYTGHMDGIDGAVPISHSINAFNALTNDSELINKSEVNKIIKKSLNRIDNKNNIGKRPILFRRVSDLNEITIFNGGHEILFESAINWLNKRHKEYNSNM